MNDEVVPTPGLLALGEVLLVFLLPRNTYNKNLLWIIQMNAELCPSWSRVDEALSVLSYMYLFVFHFQRP